MQTLVLLTFIFSVISIILVFLLFIRSVKTTDYKPFLERVERDGDKLEKTVKQEIAFNREELSKSSSELRAELIKMFKAFESSVMERMEGLTKLNENKLDKMRETMRERIESLQTENGKKLDQMRGVVDEKLHATLEKRLGEQFSLVQKQLESVHKGLGEMQSLAANVGDLKKVLTNVKTRGTWGEIQLGNLLEQILTPDQYSVNVRTKKNSRDNVEFAIKLPGQGNDPENVVWLPIDSKFPQEDYQRLLEAQENADGVAAEKYAKQLEVRIKDEARDIRDKYIDPPNTTDFGILFLPVEGLYAEVLRRPDLWEILQRDFRVIVAGPMTISAILNSLQMGFRTLAVEKRSSEVWNLLGAVKTEFGKFGGILDRTKQKLQEVTNTIDKASSKTRRIESKLKKVQELPGADFDDKEDLFSSLPYNDSNES
ncbi:MAG: DNA recombination protein RmuC [Candidatus Omnitrophica bacterium]|nr:DNA recombination protein RmuC [Candidatus Omnitrophota bacterium]MDD5080473.1 DNA recombination protein RmuC [Candidatus Omnitrophota bacterium]MDD5440733.1 DNA recombination protein RmuC [Candidatus Omnitrophota bacterium]